MSDRKLCHARRRGNLTGCPSPAVQEVCFPQSRYVNIRLSHEARLVDYWYARCAMHTPAGARVRPLRAATSETRMPDPIPTDAIERALSPDEDKCRICGHLPLVGHDDPNHSIWCPVPEAGAQLAALIGRVETQDILRHQLAAAEGHVHNLRAALATAQADTARLDWLASRRRAQVTVRDGAGEITEWGISDPRTRAVTLREAFDGAMPYDKTPAGIATLDTARGETP